VAVYFRRSIKLKLKFKEISIKFKLKNQAEESPRTNICISETKDNKWISVFQGSALCTTGQETEYSQLRTLNVDN
jgi:hypothetical protein